MVMFGLFCVFRLGEVINLKWEDIDVNNELLTITQIKTGKMINIPIAEFFIDELCRYKQTLNDKPRLFENRAVSYKVVHEYSQYFSKMFKRFNIEHTHKLINSKRIMALERTLLVKVCKKYPTELI